MFLQIFLSKAFRARLVTRTVGAGGLESEGVHCKNRLLNAKLDMNSSLCGKAVSCCISQSGGRGRDSGLEVSSRHLKVGI